MIQTLIPLHYLDAKEGIHLQGYTDTIVYKTERGTRYPQHKLIAVHFGGYPEHVKGMSDAIYGGGTLTAELPEGKLELLSISKQYDRTVGRDGTYSHGFLRLKDDSPEVIDRSEMNEPPREQTSLELPPRSCWLYTSRGDKDRLFQEIDRRVRIPLIPEFRDYLLEELQKRGILLPLSVLSSSEDFDAWELRCAKDDRNIQAVVEDGLRSGKLRIPGAGGESQQAFSEVNGVSSYLKKCGVALAERIQNRYLPLYDPAKEPLSDSVLELNSYIQRSAGYSLYEAQLAVAEAVKRKIDRHSPAMIIAECGSGKSKIGSVALIASHMAAGKKKSFNVILCPSHMTEKWGRELLETVPGAVPETIRSINGLKRLYHAYEKSRDKHFFAVMSKEKARDGYMRRPAAAYNDRLKAFLCPDCGTIITQDLTEDGVKYPIPVDAGFFRRENQKNHNCPNCGSLLWAPLDSQEQTEWVKVSNWGFVHRQFALLGSHTCKPTLVLDKLKEIDRDRNGSYPAAGAYRRFPISTYISKKMGKNKIDGFIADELQQYNNDTSQGDAMAEILRASGKFIGMTATLINGYASGIFNLLYRLVPGLMLRDGKRYTDFHSFCEEYGVTESVFETEENYAANRRSIPRKKRERMLPGVSPLVYSRFLLENAVFLSLADMGKELPEYEEFPISVPMRADIEAEYHRLTKRFQGLFVSDRRIAQRVMSAFMGLLTVYPDQPYGHKPIVNPLQPESTIVKAQDLTGPDELLEKDRQVLELIQRKVSAGERVLLYTSWVRIDSQSKLQKLLMDRGIRTGVLTSKVPPDKREAWVDKQLDSGIQVLICNPSVVETGLDLNAFTTLIYFNVSYNLFTLRQSSRRSWRINQTAPRIEVYFFYYQGTMQNRAIELMASKLAAASVIEGSISDEGLAAMSDCRDLTAQLAKELAAGIRPEVTDLAETFGKMAIRHTAGESERSESRHAALKAQLELAASRISAPKPIREAPEESLAVPDVSDQPALVETAVKYTVFAAPPRSRRKAADFQPVEGQLTLFGIPA